MYVRRGGVFSPRVCSKEGAGDLCKEVDFWDACVIIHHRSITSGISDEGGGDHRTFRVGEIWQSWGLSYSRTSTVPLKLRVLGCSKEASMTTRHFCNQAALLVLLGLSPSCSPDDTTDPAGHGSVGNEPATGGGTGTGAGGTSSTLVTGGTTGVGNGGSANGCIVNNLICTNSAQCCSGYCNMENGTNGSCTRDPAGAGGSSTCLNYDKNCIYTEECCEGSCFQGFCSRTVVCRISAASCTGSDVCCAGLVCQNRSCVSATATGGASFGGNTSVSTGGSVTYTCILSGQPCTGAFVNACCLGLTCVNALCTSST